jgi:formate hydrogenlyase subunit 3/multisubunit Na+/H+ antiporter MnhD subunit
VPDLTTPAIDLIQGASPAVALILCAVLLPLAGAAAVWALSTFGQKYPGNGWRNVREGIVWGTNGAALACVLGLYPFFGTEFELPRVCGAGLFFGVDGMRWLLAVLAGVLWLMTSLFSREYLAHTKHKMRYYFYLLVTESGILGTFLSADLFTMLVFFEIMSISSWVLVAQEETPGALRAADSYLAYAVIGGLVSLMGIFLLYHYFGTVRFAVLRNAGLYCTGSDRVRLYIAGALTMFGFAAKAGMWPLHTWLPKAHPVAPAPASALLSGIITKAGMFGILVLSGQLFWQDGKWGGAILFLGTITMVTGAVLAVFSVDLKRTLACSSMSQIGFILVGVGMSCLLGSENGSAVAGLTLHIVNHSLFKLTLFLCAGCVVMNLHRLNLNDIRGFGRGKPILMYAFAMGSFGLMGMPLFSGYISKTLLHDSIVEYQAILVAAGSSSGAFRLLEALFLLSGGLTAAYMTKLFVCLFVEKNADPQLQEKYDGLNGHYMTRLSSAVLLLCGTSIPVLGLTPYLSMDFIAALPNSFFATNGREEPTPYFGGEALLGAGISLCIGAAVYFGIVRPLLHHAKNTYRDRWPAWLDLEEKLYRPLLLQVLPFIGAAAARLAASLFEWLRRGGAHLLLRTGVGDGHITPGRDEQFTVYEREPKGVQGFTASLAYSLLLFGLGLAVVLTYLLTRL